MTDSAPETDSAVSATRPGTHRFIDRLIAKTWLLAFPRWIKPNHLTIVRLLLVPAVLVLLHYERRGWALAVFIVGLCTDFIDGAMARTRDQTSTFGIYADPVADKLLVASVLAWWVWRRFPTDDALSYVVPVFLGFIILELAFTAVGVSILLRRGGSQPSNAFGKGKMIVQSLALFLFLLAAILDLETLTDVSLYLLWAALALAMVSGAKQVLDMLRSRGHAA
jgi:CDP-diacylglycerol--glycerol-3-phosphate 3-phosphatidyltransferase